MLLVLISPYYMQDDHHHVATITKSIFTLNYNPLHESGGFYVWLKAYYVVTITESIFSENNFTGMYVYGSYKQLAIANTALLTCNVTNTRKLHACASSIDTIKLHGWETGCVHALLAGSDVTSSLSQYRSAHIHTLLTV